MHETRKGLEEDEQYREISIVRLLNWGGHLRYLDFYEEFEAPRYIYISLLFLVLLQKIFPDTIDSDHHPYDLIPCWIFMGPFRDLHLATIIRSFLSV